jgi:hypothetical protein
VKKGFLLVLLFVPVTVFGQSTLTFPRMFTASDLAATGFAIVNPGASDAEATFTLRDTAGSTIDTTTRTINTGGQFAQLGSELFPSAITPGWVQMTSGTAGLRGFWIGGDFTTFTDGADAAPSAASLMFPLVVSNTEINIANTALTESSVTISLRQADGTEMASSTQTIAGMGVFQSSTGSLFSGVDLSQATHILMTGGSSIAATAIVSDFLVSPAWGVVNGVDAAAITTELNFPHVINGAGWLTSVGVTNLTSGSNNVTITFTPCPAAGTCPGSATSVQRTIAGNGGLQESAESLFGLSASEFQEGWVQVTATSAVTGFVAYAGTAAKGLAIVPAQASSLTSMLFSHIAQAAGWATGVALLNASNTTANVEVYAMNPAGTLIGGALDAPDAAFTLAPGAKIARILNEWIPAAQTNGGFVYVRTMNGVPLYGLELFFLTNLAIMANVAPGAIADGITYTPPAPVGTITLDSLSPASVARGGTLILNGSGFSATASSNSVVFTMASGTTSQTSATATTTMLTAVVPSTAISGPVLVQIGITSSESQILEITASSSTLVETSVSVSAGQTTAGVDIYVPVPAGSLNVTSIGVGNRFQSISFASNSAEVSQGQTTDLRVAGTGISEASQSTVAVSGTGITLANISYSGNVMFIQIDVAANAALGPRTVTVTNSNLDTSVLSGGIIIK